MGGKRLILSVLLVVIFIFSGNIFAQEADFSHKLVNAVFYVMEDSKGNYQIGSMKPDGENKKILTTQGNNWCPEVDPSGTKVAFFSDRTGYGNLWVMDIDSTQQMQLTRDETFMPIDLYTRGQIGWSKDSEEIFFLKNGDIWNMDKTGASLSSVTRTHDIVSFKFSPEKLKIIYAREKTKRNIGYWLMNPDGTQVAQVAPSDIRQAAYDWMDGDTILYFTNNTITSLKVVGFERKNILSITYPDVDIACGNSPEGKDKWNAYLDTAGTDQQNIWMIKDLVSKPVQVTFKGANSLDAAQGDSNIYYVSDFEIYSVTMPKMETKKLTHYFKSFYPVAAKIRDNTAQPEQTGGKDDKKQ